MDRVLDVRFEERGNNVVDIVFEYGSDAPDVSESFSKHGVEAGIYSEILETFLKIKSDIFGDEITSLKTQHQDTTGPFFGFSSHYRNDYFKLDEIFTTDYHGRICCDFNLRNQNNKKSLKFTVGVPQYHSSYSVEKLELDMGAEINLLPRGNLSKIDEKTSKELIEYIKSNVYGLLEIPVANA
ncbi:MAG: hypothetical protein KAS90_05780 [Candidatus Aenigmarchaeota archaeon]|nr:hypothetical protein [Candidatus Aenigmarchaeota archaeon]